MREQIITYILFIISVSMFLFSALQLVLRSKTRVNLLLSLIFFTSGYLWFNYWLYRVGFFSSVPCLMYSDVAATFLIGPVAYSYARNLTGVPQKSTFRSLLKYFPAAGYIIFLFISRPGTSVSTTSGNILYPDFDEVPVVYVFNILSDIWLFVCILLTTKVIRDHIKRQSHPLAKSLRGFLLYLGISIVSLFLIFIAHSLRSDTLIGTGILITGINHIYFFFWSYRYPEYTQRVISRSRRKRNLHTLGSIDVPGVITRLAELMERAKVYREFDISLQSLSARLGIHNHQLSGILNEKMDMNFRTFINYYRIQEARQLLTEKPELSIIDVAFAVGFNSKSSFNAVFIKETGTTPREYRKKPVERSRLSKPGHFIF